MEEDHMEVEDEVRVTESHRYEEEEAVMNFEGEKEVEAMVIVEDSDEEEVEEECMRRDAEDEYIWPDAPSRKRLRYAQEVAAIREVFEDDPDYDPAMVSEYADDIFEYMQDLEVCFRVVSVFFFSDPNSRRTSCLILIIWTHRTKYRGRCARPWLIGCCRPIYATT